MTINNYPPYVSFGDLQPLSRSLWILYQRLEEEANENHLLLIEHISCVIMQLYFECGTSNISLKEYNFLINQIRLKNEAVNPIPFDWERHAYRNHIVNCFILNHINYS